VYSISEGQKSRSKGRLNFTRTNKQGSFSALEQTLTSYIRHNRHHQRVQISGNDDTSWNFSSSSSFEQ